MDDGLGGDYKSLIGGEYDVLFTTFMTQDITKGFEYRFRYRCKNVNGWGVFSEVTYIKAAIVPSIP
jgi:hypothetical protein